MTDGSSITYNYNTLDSFHQTMKAMVGQLESEVDKLKADTHKLLDGHWSGQASQAYDQQSGQIQTNLQGVGSWVDGLAGSVAEGTQNLQDTDKKMASGFQGA